MAATAAAAAAAAAEVMPDDLGAPSTVGCKGDDGSEPCSDASVAQHHAQGAVSTKPQHSNGSGQLSRNRSGRWIRVMVASIKAVLFLELASIIVRPFIASKVKRSRGSSDGESDSDLDPADVLMDYLTGSTGLAALQLLRNDQLHAAADNLVTEDFAELGVTDRGREIRSIIDDIIQAREKGVDTPTSRASKQGGPSTGRVGPLRFRNTKKAHAKEVSPPTAEEKLAVHADGSKSAAGVANASSSSSSSAV